MANGCLLVRGVRPHSPFNVRREVSFLSVHCALQSPTRRRGQCCLDLHTASARARSRNLLSIRIARVNSQLQSLTDDGRSREEIEGTDINSCKLQHDGKGNLPMKQNECRARAPLPSLFSFYIDSFSFYNRGPEPIIFNAFTILSYSTAHAALASGLVPSSFSRWEICIALITSLLACRARIRLSIT